MSTPIVSGKKMYLTLVFYKDIFVVLETSDTTV